MDSATILFFKCQKRDYSIYLRLLQGQRCFLYNLLKFHEILLTGLRHLLNPKIPTSRRNAVFFCQIFLKYMLCGVVFCAIIKYEDLV